MSFVWTTSRPCNISEQDLLGCLGSQAVLQNLCTLNSNSYSRSAGCGCVVGDRHDTKRQILQIIRRIIPRIKVRRWWLRPED